MCVPLIARDKALGAITFVSAESGRRYDEPDLATAQDLARHAAIAVDNALLFRETRGGSAGGAGVARGRRRRLRRCSGRARLHGHELPLRARERRARHDQRSPGGGALRTDAARRPRRPRGRDRAVPPAGDRDRRADPRPARDGRDSPPRPRASQLAGQLLPGPRRVRRDDRRRRRDHGRDRARAGACCRGGRERAPRVLAEASQRLASTLDYETTLANLATLLVPRFADWYAVDVVDDAVASSASRSCTRTRRRTSGSRRHASTTPRSRTSLREPAAPSAPARRFSTGRSPTSCSPRRRRTPSTTRCCTSSAWSPPWSSRSPPAAGRSAR